MSIPNHRNNNVVKHLHSHPGHFIDFKNPEILCSAFKHGNLLMKGNNLTST